MKGAITKGDAAIVARLDAIAAMLPARRRGMFGTVAWFLEANGQMVMGAWGGRAIMRVGATDAARLIASGRAAAFAPMAGRPMREYVLVDAAALSDADLRRWAKRAAAFTGGLAPKPRA
jgi:hypothetical protein